MMWTGDDNGDRDRNMGRDKEEGMNRDITKPDRPTQIWTLILFAYNHIIPFVLRREVKIYYKCNVAEICKTEVLIIININLKLRL